MSNRHRIIVVNEFRGDQSPVAAIVTDFLEHFENEAPVSYTHISTKGKYKAGGLSYRRISNLVYLHLKLPWVVLAAKVKSLFLKEKLYILTTTSPPLIQWTSIVIGKALSIPSFVWYMDAHPELEARILDRSKFSFASRLLRFIDKILLKQASKTIVLDDSMAQLVKDKAVSEDSIQIVPPWKTFLEPAKSLKQPRADRTILVYAGNFGSAHDLSSLTNFVQESPLEVKNKLEVHFVGMARKTVDHLISKLNEMGVASIFHPRFESKNDLAKFFDTCDFGIVSLSHNYEGISCPSKVYSYVSQGLPIVFVGPKNSLGGHLVHSGWGYFLDDKFRTAITYGRFDSLNHHIGQVYENPREKSLSSLSEFILGYS